MIGTQQQTTSSLNQHNYKAKILVVLDGEVDRIPPVKNLIEVLLRNGHQVTLIACGPAESLRQVKPYIKSVLIPYNPDLNRIKRTVCYFRRRKRIRDLVKEEMQFNDILWTTWDSVVACIGKDILRYKHIMQIMELTEYIPAFPHQNLLRINAKKYARHAFKVVVPEYNRAHIQKTWWNLEHVPVVLPNKTASEEFDREHITDDVKAVLDDLDREKRKIILYQGVFYQDRDLDQFAAAIDKMPDEYSLYLMGRRTDYLDYLISHYSNIHYIPFITPPYHLLVTERAYIGLLPYKAVKSFHYSELNALYCAPNKIFEYAQFGVPMLGTDVPGLALPFSQYDMGYVCEKQTKGEIMENIKKIEARYEIMRANCRKFYDSVDLDSIVEKILYEEP